MELAADVINPKSFYQCVAKEITETTRQSHQPVMSFSLTGWLECAQDGPAEGKPASTKRLTCSLPVCLNKDSNNRKAVFASSLYKGGQRARTC